MTDTGDLWDSLNPSAVITGVNCCSSPLEVNREYHTLFVCLSKGKKYLLEMNDNHLLLAVSSKSFPSYNPAEGSERMLYLKMQRP